MKLANKCYLLAPLFAVLAVAALAIDIPVAGYARENWLPGDVRKLLTISEVFAHGFGVALILITILVLDPSNRHRVPRVATCAYLTGALALLSKHLLPRVRPSAFDDSGDVFSTFLGVTRWAQSPPGGLTGYPIQSFPSGHTATAVGLALGLAWLYPRGRWLFALFAVLAAAQRIQASAHFVSDTFAAAAMACIIAGICLDERLLGRSFTRLEQRLASAANECPCGSTVE
jgi:membrane-associated phospholipid phosphatase